MPIVEFLTPFLKKYQYGSENVKKGSIKDAKTNGSMKKRTVIITGANSGIGKAASEIFSEEGHIVIMACRDLEKSRPVQQNIIEKTGNVQVYLEELDVSSFESIRKFCSEYRNKYHSLDILIHNAAYFNHGADYRLSPDGIELTFATNVFGPYLMTMLLKDLLAQSEDPRILHAGSNIVKHFLNPKKEIDFDNLRGESKDSASFSVYTNYRNSKMALLMLTFRLADAFKEDGIGVYSLQINGARMSKDTLMKVKPHYRILARIQNLFFRPPEFTAGLYYEICTNERFSSMSGSHFNHKLEAMQPAKVNDGILTDIKQGFGAGVYPAYALREDVSNKLWKLCEEWTGEVVHS